MHAVVAQSGCRSQNVENDTVLGAFLDVLMSFSVAGARASALSQKPAQCEGFVAVSKPLADVGHFVLASTVLYTHETEKSQNALAGGHQLSIFKGCLAELLRF